MLFRSSAGYIQEYDIDTHIIIEANNDVFEHLKDFSKKAQKPVVPLFGFWQTAVNDIEPNSISGILFDTYPLTEDEVHRNHFDFFKTAYNLLKPGGILTYYSDEIDDFSEDHRHALKEAGFQNIDKEVCSVTPPEDCEYWKSPTIVAPIIYK